VFCKTEDFFGESLFRLAAGMTQDMAVEALTEKIYNLNSDALKKDHKIYQRLNFT